MAKKKVQEDAGSPRRGPKPSKNGILAKVQFVETQLAGKGITRLEAVKRLMKKFPEISESYARAIIFSRCTGMSFVAVRAKKGSKSGAGEAPAKDVSPKKKTVTSAKASAKAPPKRVPSTRKKKSVAPADEEGFVTDFGV